MTAKASALHEYRLIVALGLAIELLFVGGPLRLFFLPTYYSTPLQDLGKLTDFRVDAAIGFLLIDVAAFALYVASLHVARRIGSSSSAIIAVATFGILFTATLAFVYPYGAVDIFDYSFYGRIMTHYGGNPFLEVPSRFAGDIFLPFVAWKDLPFTYGPIWALLSYLASSLGGDNLLVVLLLYKAIPVAFYAASLWLVVDILSRTSRSLTLPGLVLFAWNPLVVTEVGANGHNDIVMMSLVLLAIRGVIVSKGKAMSGLATITTSSLVKFASAMLLPLFAACLWQSHASLARRTYRLAAAFSTAILLAALAYLPLWQGISTLAVQRRQDLFTVSFAAIVKMLPEARFAVSDARFVGYAAVTSFAIYVLVESARLRLGSAALIAAAYRLTVVYLFLACLWFQPWYLVWPVTLGALMPQRVDIMRLTVLFSFTATLNYFVFDYFWAWNASDIDVFTIQLVAVAVVHAAPLAYAARLVLPLRRRAASALQVA